MKRWWLVVALMLSVGVNLGIVVGRLLPSDDARHARPRHDGEGPGPEGHPGGPPPGGPPHGGPPHGGPPHGGPPGDGPPGEAGEPRVPPAVKRFAEEVGLAEEDQEKFVELHRSFLKETMQARRRVMELQEELRQTVFAEEVDREAADALLEQLGAAHVGLESAFIHNLLDVREMLDAEQQQTYRRFLRRLRQRAGDPRQGGGPGGRPPPPREWRPGERPPGGPGMRPPPGRRGERRRPRGEGPPGPPGEGPPGERPDPPGEGPPSL